MEMEPVDRNKQLKVLILASEVSPYAKLGGLGDASASLAKSLRKLGADVRVALPFYRSAKQSGCEFEPVIEKMEVPFGDQVLATDVWRTTESDGGSVYFFDREDLFDRPNFYGSRQIGDYFDNLERFIFFSRAGILLAKRIGFRPGIVHLHDWETGAVSVFLRSLYGNDPFFYKTSTVFSFHNAAYQGNFPPEKLAVTGLPFSLYNLEGIEFWGQISLLKAGIVFSDAVTTVSPTYAREVCTPQYGLGMEGVVNRRGEDFQGVLPGVDYDVWNPETDTEIAANYGPKDLSGKKVCRDRLFQELELDSKYRDGLVLGWVSRLVEHKGTGLIVQAMRNLMNLNVTLVVAGDGEESYRKELKSWEQHFPGRIRVRFVSDDRLVRKVTAGSDLLLLPCKYEPSGLAQMYAIKYGTIPVVRRTGGLADVVRPYDPDTGEGWGFAFDGFSSDEFTAKLREAAELMGDADHRGKLIQNAMSCDFSCEHTGRRYLEIYEKVLK